MLVNHRNEIEIRACSQETEYHAEYKCPEQFFTFCVDFGSVD
jgi:hypothetical protein